MGLVASKLPPSSLDGIRCSWTLSSLSETWLVSIPCVTQASLLLNGALDNTWCIRTLTYPNFYASYYLSWTKFERVSAFVLARLGFIVCLSKTQPFSFCSSLGLIFLLCFVYKGLDFTSSQCALCLMARPSCLFVEMLVEFFIVLDLIVGESSRLLTFFIYESWC